MRPPGAPRAQARSASSSNSTAGQIGVSPEIVVAAQAVGGAAGIIVTMHNVVAASATVGLLGREGDLIRAVPAAPPTPVRLRRAFWPPTTARA